MERGNRVLWVTIKDTLEKHLGNWAQRVEDLNQLNRIAPRAMGATYSNEEVFEAVVKAVLSSATDWARIQPLLPTLRERFKDFELEWYSGVSETFVKGELVPWFMANNAGSPPLERNLLLLRRTVRQLLDRSKKFGSIEIYIQKLLKLQAGDVVLLARELGAGANHKLACLGMSIAAETLKNIGYDVAKPDRHVNRAMGCFRLYRFASWPDRGGCNAPKATPEDEIGVMYAVRDLALELEVPITLVDNAIWLLCCRSGAALKNAELTRLAGAGP